MTDPHAQTRVDMFELGWFGQGPAFWRWVRSDANWIEATFAEDAPPPNR